MSTRAAPLLLAPALVLLAAFLVLPLLVAATTSLRFPLFDPRAYTELAGGSFRIIVYETMRDSALVALACLLLGLPAAYVYVHLNPRYLPVIMLAILVPYFTSTLIRSYAWIAILGNQGLVNRGLLSLGLVDTPVKLAYTWFGMIVAMAQVQLPLFIIPVLAVMRRVDPRLVRAAKTLGADAVTAFFTVYLPLIAPGVTAAVVMVFMTTLGFYVTPALLGPPSTMFLSQSIEMRINNLADQPGAAAQSIVLLALTLLLAAVFFHQLRAAFVPPEQDALSATPRRRRRRFAPGILLEPVAAAVAPFRWIAFGAIAIITTLLLIGPLLVLFPLSFSDARYLSFPPASYSWRWYQAYLLDSEWIAATWLSLRLGLLGASIATVCGGLAAFGIVALSRTRRTVSLLTCAVPMVVSPMVLGAAMFYVAARFGWVGSSAILIAGYAVLSLPYPVLVLTAALSRFDWQLPKAAATLGAPPAAAFTTVVLPILLPAVASGFIFSFFLGFDDVNVALFLADPYAQPLQLVMLNNIRDEINPRTSAVAVVFFMGAVVMSLLFALGRQAWLRARAWRGARLRGGMGMGAAR